MTPMILICGATGFIGRNLVEFFGQDRSNRLRLVFHQRDPFDVSHLKADVEWVEADLLDPIAVEKLMDGVSYVIQAAATTSGSKDITTKPYIHVTDNAVMNSLLLRSAYHANVDHFIFFSCTVMYQSSEYPVSEDGFDPSVPIHNKYFGVGNTKVYIENMLEFFSSISTMKTTSIRHSNIYGPFDKFDFERSHVFGATISKVMLSDKEIVVWGTGEEERDLLHVHDLCQFVDLAIKNQKAANRVYNAGLGKKISIRDLVKLIIKSSQKDLTISHDESQPTIKTSLCLNCDLALREIGWKPSISLEEGVPATLKWWGANIDKNTLKHR